MTTQALTPTALLQALNVTLGEQAVANAGPEPLGQPLQALQSRSETLTTLIAGQPSSVGTIIPHAIPGSAPGPVRNPGLKMPKPEGGFGLVLVDFDKTLFSGDTHMRLVSLGLQTRFDEIRKLANPAERLIETLKMTWRYKRHTLDPTSAADAVATLLDGIPVLQVAREWADAGARAGIKRGVLSLVREQAREIVRGEVQELIRQGRMSAPLAEPDLEEEAKTRIFVLSSQFADVLRMLTDVGPEHENLLGFNAENVLGSRGTFTPQGNFVSDDQFQYCFDQNKPKMAEEEFKSRGLEWNADTTRTFSDDVWYDRFLLAMAHKPENRFIIDPDPRDADYGRHEGTQVVYDRWDLGYRARWVHSLKGRRKRKKLEVIQDQRFYPDSRSVASMGDAWGRALYGAAEMIPLAVVEGALHRFEGGDFHLAAAAIPIGAGLLYGPLNRSVVGNLLVGTVAAGGMAMVHAGDAGILPVAASLLGGGLLALGQGLLRTLAHEHSAKELGHKGFRPQTRFMSFIGRTAVTSAWFALMRLFGLG